MGAENLGGGGLGGELVHPESTGWGTILILGLEGIFGDHGSHEDIIIIGGESLWHNSGVSGGTNSSGESWLEVVSLELDVSLIIIGGVALGIGFSQLGSRLVWWSAVGLLNGMISILLLDGGVGSVIVNGSEGPDWLSSGGNTEEYGNSKGEFHVYKFIDYKILQGIN